MDIIFKFNRPVSHYYIINGIRSIRTEVSENSWHKGRADLDNLIKFVLDALNGVMYIDDHQIVSIKARKEYVTADESPCTEISLYKV